MRVAQYEASRAGRRERDIRKHGVCTDSVSGLTFMFINKHPSDQTCNIIFMYCTVS